MNISYLEEFVLLARELNYHLASGQLGVSQPTLSNHIRALEKEIGRDLFVRSTRDVQLTDFGEKFLKRTNEFLRAYQIFRNGIYEDSAMYREVLSIAVLPLATTYNITELISKFKIQNPFCFVEIHDVDVSKMKNMLRQKKCDFAFLPSTMKTDPEFAVSVVAVDKHVVVMPKTHALAARGAIQIKELEKESIHTLPPESLTYDLLLNECKKEGFAPNLEIAGAGARLLIGVAENHHGVSVMMKQEALNYLTDNVVMVDLVPPLPVYINCYYSRDEDDLTQVSRIFLSFVKNYSIS